MARVLLVDDDSAGLELRKLIFEREGHQIFAATDPVRALALFTEVQPDCVVLDLRLPEAADGLALIRELRGASPSSVSSCSRAGLSIWKAPRKRKW